MAQSVLSDELLRQLIAVGQVDILVGVPTLDNAATVGVVVRAVHKSFATDFPRERTVLINCDGGSRDGTTEAVRGASLRDGETLIAPQGLRTIHRISAPYHGLPGKAGALRTLFAAAELLQARAVAVFDADVTSIEPGWVARLVRPVLAGQAEFVSPVFQRHPLDGLLVTQLVRPLLRAAYGRGVREPLASEFACSGGFAAHCRAQPVWDGPLVRDGIDLWLTASALAARIGCAEAPLGPRVAAPKHGVPALPEIFRQVAGTLFSCLELHEASWLASNSSEPVTSTGPPLEPPAVAPHLRTETWVDAFREGVRDLAPVLDEILSPVTLEGVRAAAQANGGAPAYPDAVWVATIYDAAVAHRRGKIHRDHVTQALVPLYLGRAAAFVGENATREPAQAERALDSLCGAYERAKPYLVETWPRENGR